MGVALVALHQQLGALWHLVLGPAEAEPHEALSGGPERCLAADAYTSFCGKAISELRSVQAARTDVEPEEEAAAGQHVPDPGRIEECREFVAALA
jgi:hypothetical protein